MNHKICHHDDMMRGKRRFSISHKDDDGRNGIIQSSQCSKHEDLTKQWFCMNCSEVVCVWCMVSDHKNHTCKSLEYTAQKCQRKTEELLQDVQNEIANSLKSLEDLQTQHRGVDRQSIDLEEDINNRYCELKFMLESWYADVMSELKTKSSKEKERIQTKIEAQRGILDELNEAKTLAEEVLSSATDVDYAYISRSIDNEHKKILDLSTKDNELKHMSMVFTQTNDMNADMCGKLVSFESLFSSNRMYRSSNSCKLLSSFDSREGISNQYMATGITTTEDGSIVISDLGLDEVRLYMDGKLKVVLDTLNDDRPTCTSIFDSSHFAVVCKNKVKIFNNKGQYVRPLKSRLNSPRGICRHPLNNDFVISDVGEDTNMLYVFDNELREEKNIVIGEDWVLPSHQPWYVANHASQSSVIISDYAQHHLQLIDLDEGHHKVIGCHGAGPGQFLHPAGVCVDRCGHILVADHGNDRVQMFSADGQWLSILIDSSSGLNAPTDVATDDLGFLWVLQANGVVRQYQYIYYPVTDDEEDEGTDMIECD